MRVPHSLRARVLLALDGGAETADDIATGLDVHRSTAMRLLEELEAMRLVERTIGSSTQGQRPYLWRLVLG